MRRPRPADITVVFGAIFVMLCMPARAQTTLTLIKQIDHVEHPNLLEKLWKSVDSDHQNAVLSVLTWPELKQSMRVIQDVNVTHDFDHDYEYKGEINPPVGYTVCHAHLKDPVISCGGAFTGEYDNKNKLDYTIVFQKTDQNRIQPGKCSLSGTIIITFVIERERSKLTCGPSGNMAFSYKSQPIKSSVRISGP